MIDFDNIHIVIRENDPDEMWFGLSLWCDGNIEKQLVYLHLRFFLS